MPQQPWKPRAVVATALTLAFTAGCIPQQDQARETPVNDAQPGDVLVIAGNTDVVLTKPFKPGMPNGLYDGAVSVKNSNGETNHYEVNTICSLPDLPGWPDYDNIYGKSIQDPNEAGLNGGNTEWQLLIKFEGKTISKGKQKAPAWAERLAQNLCRKGDFKDTMANRDKSTLESKTPKKPAI